MLKRLAKELCVYILAGVVIWFCIITISGGESVKLGISEAVDRCMNIIIPSLFVFMALSQILVSSGLYYCVSMPFYPISRFIMGIPPQLFFVFLLGNTAGYPVGVKLLSDLCQRKIISQCPAFAAVEGLLFILVQWVLRCLAVQEQALQCSYPY